VTEHRRQSRQFTSKRKVIISNQQIQACVKMTSKTVCVSSDLHYILESRLVVHKLFKGHFQTDTATTNSTTKYTNIWHKWRHYPWMIGQHRILPESSHYQEESSPSLRVCLPSVAYDCQCIVQRERTCSYRRRFSPAPGSDTNTTHYTAMARSTMHTAIVQIRSTN